MSEHFEQLVRMLDGEQRSVFLNKSMAKSVREGADVVFLIGIAPLRAGIK